MPSSAHVTLNFSKVLVRNLADFSFRRYNFDEHIPSTLSKKTLDLIAGTMELRTLLHLCRAQIVSQYEPHLRS